jgi:hypothetical protein
MKTKNHCKLISHYPTQASHQFFIVTEGMAITFYQFFKHELKLSGFNCEISRYISKLSPHNLLRRIGITVQRPPQNIVVSKQGPCPLGLMPGLLSVLSWLV